LHDIILMVKVPASVVVAGMVENNRSVMGKLVLARPPWWSTKTVVVKSMPYTATPEGAHIRQLEARDKFGTIMHEKLAGKEAKMFGGQHPVIALAEQGELAYKSDLRQPETKTARPLKLPRIRSLLRRKIEEARRTGGEYRAVGAPIRL
jgi:hypothetical protein